MYTLYPTISKKQKQINSPLLTAFVLSMLIEHVITVESKTQDGDISVTWGCIRHFCNHLGGGGGVAYHMCKRSNSVSYHINVY